MVKKKYKLPGAKTTIKYAKGKSSKRSLTMVRVSPETMEGDDAPMGPINGMMPQSSYEWNIARALWKMGWDFEYQVAVHGGWNMRGGQVLDFMVKTLPAKTPLAVDGGYWHSNLDEEKLGDVDLLSALRDAGYMVVNEVKHAGDKDCAHYEDALAFISANFGRN